MKELQYDKKFYNKLLIVVMIAALVMQSVSIYSLLRDQYINLSVLDYFVLNINGTIGVENIIAWILPIMISIFIGAGYNFYREISVSLFTRINQKKFIYKRAVKTYLIGFVATFLFYIFCFIYMIIIVKIISPQSNFGVSFDMLEMTISPYLFSLYPLLYLGVYIAMISLFGGLFSLIAYYASLLIKNKVIVFIVPFIYIIINTFICEIIPYGHYFNYNNLNILNPTRYSYYGGDKFYVFLIPISIILQTLLFTVLIKARGKKDLC